jgi:hypothetical protein
VYDQVVEVQREQVDFPFECAVRGRFLEPALVALGGLGLEDVRRDVGPEVDRRRLESVPVVGIQDAGLAP